LAGVLATTLLAAGCAGEADPGTTWTPAPPTSVATTREASPDAVIATTVDLITAEYVENFQFVWATINDGFYDPDFGGIDWDEVHDRYLSQIPAVDDDRTFIELMNRMVTELGVSHLFVLPPEVDFVDPVLTTKGELGIHVRLLDGEPSPTSQRQARCCHRSTNGVCAAARSLRSRRPCTASRTKSPRLATATAPTRPVWLR
jgi:hypothetical protein